MAFVNTYKINYRKYSLCMKAYAVRNIDTEQKSAQAQMATLATLMFSFH